MYCSKCGKENLEGAVYCANCGNALDGSVQSQENINMDNINNQSFNGGNKEIPKGTAGMRKQIKAEAKKQPKSGLIGANIVSFILVFVALICVGVFSALTIKVTGGIGAILAFLVIILVVVAFWFCYIGITMSSLNVARGEQLSFKDILWYGGKKYKSVLKLVAVTIAYSVFTVVCNFIPILGSIVLLICSIYLTPVMTMLIYYFSDEKNESVSIVDGVKNCMNLVKGHRIEYYGLVFSFFGWYLLGICTLGILYIWLIPYISIAFANYYRRITGECSFDSNETGMSNGFIVGLVAGAYIFIIILVILIVFVVTAASIEKNTYDSYNNNSYYNNNYNSKWIN